MQLFNGKEYLQIDIANNFGLDKEDWDVRLNWFRENEHQLDTLIKQADEPALYFSGLQAWNDYKKRKPSSYPISLDATSSGIQILAALTGDRKAAMLCNLINTGHREDAYTGIYNQMVDTIGDEAKIDRKETKKAIMTSFYGSTAQPKNVFGEGKLLDVFYDTLKELAPGAWELNEAMLALWNPEALHYAWVLPDNFHVNIKVMSTVSENVHFLNKPYEVSFSVNAPIEKGRSLGANMTHSLDGMIVREILRRCMYDVSRIEYIRECLNRHILGHNANGEGTKEVQLLWDHYQRTGFLSARILDHLYAHNLNLVDKHVILELLDSLPKKPFQVISIHDCFRCLPNYGNDLRKQYNLLLSNIAKSNLLSDILTQITGRKITIQKLDPNLWIDILDADYALS